MSSATTLPIENRSPQFCILAGFATIILMVGCFCPSASVAANQGAEKGIWSFVLENDLFANADDHYTNGLRVSWLSGKNQTSEWALNLADRFPLFPADKAVRMSFSLGQNMYTPEDITLENPPLDDRPYAGWLYTSVGLVAETGQRLDQLELSVGVVGPASLAEQSQKRIHSFVDSDDPRGWDTQLKNEPGFILTYARSWRGLISKSLLGVPFDLTPHAGVALGNVFTTANAGVTLRYGENMPNDYGPPRIQPSLPGSGFFIPQHGFGWYLFAGIEGRAVARDIFLDGNTFRDSRSVDKEPVVGDLQFGIVMTWQSLRLAYTHVLRTREFKNQGSRRGDFGAFSLSVHF